MGAVPTVYRWDDDGAPANPASSNGYDRSAVVGQALKACLVDGYGSKAAAGWAAYDVVWPTGSSDGHIVFENASMSGVADFRMQGASARVETLAAGWDGSQLVDPVPYNYTLSGSQTFLVDDARSVRWCVVANGRACILLLWRDPSGLSGENLSRWNGVAMAMGELVPAVAEFGTGSAPNFATFQMRSMEDGDEPIGASNQTSSVISRVTAAGVANVSGGEGFHQHGAYGYSGAETDYRFSSGAPSVPFLPLYIKGSDTDNNLQFGRWPGLWLMAGVPKEDVLLEDRDTHGIWTGSPESVGGQDRVLVISRKYYGWVSFAAEDWP